MHVCLQILGGVCIAERFVTMLLVSSHRGSVSEFRVCHKAASTAQTRTLNPNPCSVVAEAARQVARNPKP